MTVKMGGSLPNGEHNGLAAELPDLLRNPKKKRVVIGVVDVVKITDEVESGDRTPQIRIRRIEIIGEDDLAMAHRLLQRAWEARSGDEMLPIEMEDELSELFDGVELLDDGDEGVPGDESEREPDAAERAAGDDTHEPEIGTADGDGVGDIQPSDDEPEVQDLPDLPDDYATPDDAEDLIPDADDLFKEPQHQ